MAARQPFWKWRRWKSIGFCLWPPSTCIWNLKLKFQSKLDLCSGNHVVYRQTDGRTDGRTRWIQYTPPPPPTSLGGGIKTDETQCYLIFTGFEIYMMTSSNGNISALLALCAGNSPVTENSPHKGQWCGALMFSLICVWINGWVNNREAGDLRRHRAHYDVSVMICVFVETYTHVYVNCFSVIATWYV